MKKINVDFLGSTENVSFIGKKGKKSFFIECFSNNRKQNVSVLNLIPTFEEDFLFFESCLNEKVLIEKKEYLIVGIGIELVRMGFGGNLHFEITVE